jgi:hypothetical protein
VPASADLNAATLPRVDIDDWLIKKNVEEAAMTRGIFNYTRKTFYVAMAALLAAIVGIIVTILHS